jgi:glucose/arabinose dehydrogenase
MDGLPLRGGREMRRRTVLTISAAIVALAASGPQATSLAQQSPSRAGGGITVIPVATGLRYPAGFTIAPDGRILYGERLTGQIRFFDPETGTDTLFGTIPDLATAGEQGLLGIALHPDYPVTPLVFAYATRFVDGPISPVNQIIRMKDQGGTAVQPRVIWESDVELTDYHQGGRILFGPDGKLYAVEGNHGPSANSQDLTNTAGKILRMGPNGAIPPDNPHPFSYNWAYGLRNSFGFHFDPLTGNLWESDAGPICGDEINLIVKAGNYGYGPGVNCRDLPESMNSAGPNPILPEYWWGPVITPVGIAFCQGCGLPDSEGRMFFANWNMPSQIQRAVLSADRTDIVSLDVVYTHIRNLISMEVGPDGALYVSDDRTIGKLVPG